MTENSFNLFGTGLGNITRLGLTSDRKERKSDFSSNSDSSITHSYRGKVKAQDVYGGPLMFGGGSSSRRNRLLTQTPYSATKSHRFSWLNKSNTSQSKSPPNNDAHPEASQSKEKLRFSTKSILNTLKNMAALSGNVHNSSLQTSGPVLYGSSSILLNSTHDTSLTPNSKRRRPDLSSAVPSNKSNIRALLRGPPVRKLMSPINPQKKTQNFLGNISTLRSQETLCSVESPNGNNLSSLSVPAIPGVLVENPSVSRGTAKPHQADHTSPTIIELENCQFQIEPNSKQIGKIRTRLCKPHREAKSLESPIPPPILKSVPCLNLNGFQSIKPRFLKDISTPENLKMNEKNELKNICLPTSPKQTTLSDAKVLSQKPFCTSPVMKDSSSFKFSDPVEIANTMPEDLQILCSTKQTEFSSRFTFSTPLIVSQCASECTEISSKPPVLQMPDLMSGPAFSVEGRYKQPSPASQSLKLGSVSEIFGGIGKLPDVTGIGNFSGSGKTTWTINKTAIMG